MIRRWLADRLFRVVFRLAECRHDTPRPGWDLAQGKLRDQATEEYWTAHRARQDAQTRAEIQDELRQRRPRRLRCGIEVPADGVERTAYLDGDQ